MNTFWEKVSKCKHKNKTQHYSTFDCATPYCTIREERCADCGVYIVTCGCGYYNGYHGWSLKRIFKHERKKINMRKK